MLKIKKEINKSDKRFEIIIPVAKDVYDIGGTLYLVGGIIRDIILNKKNKDIDVEIHGITPEVLLDILSKYGEVDKVGASFGVYKIKGIDIDFAMPRTEIKVGATHKDFEINVNPFIGIEGACIRRDLTANCLMFNVLTNEIIDCFGGIEDLHKGLLKHISDKTFTEDPLRVFRTCQFSARFDFKIAEETKALCSKMDLSSIARERVFEELNKAIKKSNNPSIFFRELKSMKKLSPFFSELEEVSDIVFERIMNDIDKSDNDIVNVLSVIAFNLNTYNYEKLINKISTELIYTKTIPIINELIKANEKIESSTQFRQLAYDSIRFSEKFVNSYILNMHLDKDASLIFKNNYMTFKSEIDTPLVQGRELMEQGIKPGKMMGQMIKEAMRLQIKGIKDKETILNIVLKKI